MKGENKMKKIKMFIPTNFNYIIVNKKSFAKYALLKKDITKKVNYVWKTKAKADAYFKRNKLNRNLHKVEKVAL